MPPPKAPVKKFKAHQGSCNAIALDKNGSYCVTAGTDRSVKLWNPYKGLLIKTYSGHGYEVLDVSISSDNSKIASCGGDKLAYYWDVTECKIIRKIGGTQAGGHTQRLNCICFAAFQDSVLVTGSYDTSIRLWDLRSNNSNPIQVLENFKDSVTSLDIFSHQILASSTDGTFALFDVRTGTITIDEISPVNKPVTSVCFSHDYNCVLAASLDSTLRLYDKNTGELIAFYRGHRNTDFKIQCTLNHQDEFVAVGSEDGLVYVWDLVDGSEKEHDGVLATLDAHQGPVVSLQFHPNQNYAFSGGHDGNLVVWN